MIMRVSKYRRGSIEAAIACAVSAAHASINAERMKSWQTAVVLMASPLTG